MNLVKLISRKKRHSPDKILFFNCTCCVIECNSCVVNPMPFHNDPWGFANSAKACENSLRVMILGSVCVTAHVICRPKETWNLENMANDRDNLSKSNLLMHETYTSVGVMKDVWFIDVFYVHFCTSFQVLRLTFQLFETRRNQELPTLLEEMVLFRTRNGSIPRFIYGTAIGSI